MAKRYSIAIGINDYPEHEQLDFCEKDAKDITATFTTFCHVDEENTRILTSSKQSPRSNLWRDFCDTIDDLKKEFSKDEDDVFFYFSGHGVQAANTTTVFKDQQVTINQIIVQLNILNPRNLTLFFDSCYSGAGYDEKSRSAMEFSLAGKIADGLNIFCSCSKDQTAKESYKLRNGRFTRFLIDTISNLQNYNKSGILDVNIMFSKVNSFLQDPKFEQNPYQQIRGTGIYPLANNFNDENFYSRFVLSDPNDIQWSEVADALNHYLNNRASIKGDFILLIKEMVSNISDPKKGAAKDIVLEITKNSVSLTDNGIFFDLFKTPSNIQSRGGTETAIFFKQQYGGNYEYHFETEIGKNTYLFEFKEEELIGECSVRVPSFRDSFSFIRDLKINEVCPHYTVTFERRAVHLSHAYMLLDDLIKISKSENKKIFMDFAEGDWIGNGVANYINMHGAIEHVEVRYYKD